MDLSQQPLFKMMQERMDYLGQRQKVLAENIANANTPGYRPNDLKPLDFADQFRKELRKVRPVATNPMHLAGVVDTGSFAMAKPKSYEISPSGNGVVLEEQMMKVADTQTDYATTTQLYSKYLQMMKMVLKS